MKQDFFDRDVNVARVGAVASNKLDDEFFNRETDVARIPMGGDEPQTESTPALSDAIRDNAAGPKRVQGDSGSVEQHSLQDQIAAEKFLQSKKAAQGKGFPVRLFKISPDGTS